MNQTEIVRTFTSGSVLRCLHLDGGVSLLRGGPGNAEGIEKPECFLSASRDGWDLIVERMTPQPAGTAHDGVAWMDEAMGQGGNP